MKKCTFCKEPFISKSKINKFCSEKCRYKYGNNKRKKPKKNKKCKHCKIIFIPINIIQKYCSKKCKKAHKNKNPFYRLNRNMSTSINQYLKCNNLSKNRRHYETLIINTIQEIIEHLEKNFLPGMSWKNYGRNGWHIDHIIPKEFFKFTSTDDIEFKMCWSINNLQPLWELDNIKKGDKVMLWGKEINARDIDKYTNAI